MHELQLCRKINIGEQNHSNHKRSAGSDTDLKLNNYFSPVECPKYGEGGGGPELKTLSEVYQFF